MSKTAFLLLCAALLATLRPASSAFVASPPVGSRRRAGATALCAEIASPFDADAASSDASTAAASRSAGLELTVANVDTVLDEVRPYLVADGGNVAVVGVDEATRSVQLQLEGACGSCPSSTVTMKMGIERVLNENFADLGEVVAVDPGPEAGASELSPDVVDAALEQIMPAIIGLGGKIEVISAEGDEVMLKYEGPPKIKFGIELALKDNPLIENVVFL